ncbi:MAG TPA: hypothetical protein VF796_02560, partial [Humisphaera sp.]
PAWVNQQLDVDRRTTEVGLRGAHLAQTDARAALRQQVDALRLGESTVGRAAAMDERVERAVADAVQRARASRVVYRADGVDVRVSLDLELLWRGLSATNDPR